MRTYPFSGFGRAMGFLVEGSEAAQKALMGAGLLQRMVTLADAQPDSELAQCKRSSAQHSALAQCLTAPAAVAYV
jgi:hypothetical protein